MSLRHRLQHSRFSCRIGPILYFAVLLLLALSLIAVERMRNEPEPRSVSLSASERLSV